MRWNLGIFLSVISVVFLCVPAIADVGIVVAEDFPSCGFFVVETIEGYTLLEWYGGTLSIFTGDIVYGDLNSYGFKDIDISGGGEVYVWVEEYWASEREAAQFFYGECD